MELRATGTQPTADARARGNQPATDDMASQSLFVTRLRCRLRFRYSTRRTEIMVDLRCSLRGDSIRLTV